MAKLEELTSGVFVGGVVPNQAVSVLSINWIGDTGIELIYKNADGQLGQEMLFRDDEPRLTITEAGRPWSFDADGASFRLVSEANRLRLAHLFDPVLAVNTSLVEPLPHQITAVYESLLTRQPLRYLLADDPGAGKTIMAGLLIKELIARGDLRRCLVVCPGSLAEQWQDELYTKFGLRFDIATNDKLEASHSGNWFNDVDLAIARLDKLSRDEDVQAKLGSKECTWDLVIFDEAHKLSASYFGGEVRYTKRYHLGELLSGQTRNLLLMTATPHNGKEADFQLFMKLIDGDRFEGRFRDGVHAQDVSDLMRRMIKEDLVKFDGKPLFPKRFARSVPFKLSDREALLYREVTNYVKDEFNRAEALANDKRRGTVGFALTILQRRLASSPAAIFESLRRRRDRLETRLEEVRLMQRGGAAQIKYSGPSFDDDDLDELEDAPWEEVVEAEEKVLDQATAARTVDEFRAEISTLERLVKLAAAVRNSGEDTKWQELSQLFDGVFIPKTSGDRVAEGSTPYSAGDASEPQASPHQKLVIFTEHRDTLSYLETKIAIKLGSPEAIVTIHGGVGRDDRLKAQSAFRNDPEVRVLLATDAAGEGINLQRAHLMVNYDLPWNPNRIEQRFGRIHRIGQTQDCHLWNMVADETREGYVYHRLIEKLEQARQSLGGRVFDVMGQLEFNGKSLRELLIEAVRSNSDPESQKYIDKVLDDAVDQDQLAKLFSDKSLVPDSMDSSALDSVREKMQRAEAQRLQPLYVESFFLEAFKRLGGTLREREQRRFQVSRVPARIRNRDRSIGTREPVMPAYERIAFEKDLIAPPDQPLAEFVCPGNPLLDSVLDLTIEDNRNLLKQGAILVDEADEGTEPRVLFYLDHSIRDAVVTSSGSQRTVSRKMLYVELDSKGKASEIQYAPYLDYRPLLGSEPSVEEILDLPETSWITADTEKTAIEHASATLVPQHRQEVRERRVELVKKTRAAVKERLTKEINYWDHRAETLRAQEQAGKVNAKQNSQQARRNADDMQARLQGRLEHLDLEDQISAQPPVAVGGVLIVPIGLLKKMNGEKSEPKKSEVDKQAVAAHAREIVMAAERSLGNEPVDREFEKVGWDIESRIPGDNDEQAKLRFIEVKGRSAEADTVTVTSNEIRTAINKPDDYVLAIVEFFDKTSHKLHYVWQPFSREPDFNVTSVNYNMKDLLARRVDPA